MTVLFMMSVILCNYMKQFPFTNHSGRRFVLSLVFWLPLSLLAFSLFFVSPSSDIHQQTWLSVPE